MIGKRGERMGGTQCILKGAPIQQRIERLRELSNKPTVGFCLSTWRDSRNVHLLYHSIPAAAHVQKGKKDLTLKITEHWNRPPVEVLKSPSLEVLKTPQTTFLYNLLNGICASRGLGFRGSLRISTILRFSSFRWDGGILSSKPCT